MGMRLGTFGRECFMFCKCQVYRVELKHIRHYQLNEGGSCMCSVILRKGSNDRYKIIYNMVTSALTLDLEQIVSVRQIYY